jgi:predicted type IV restriction endonuclease
MDFIDEIKAIAKTVEKLQHQIQNEEATKTAFIMPFIKTLGYDVFNPMEVHPEFTADVPGMNGKKVDYAICIEDKPVILIECKHCQEDINKPIHKAQLHTYFHTTESKVGILTNGIIYYFYTDTKQANIMDDKPFFEFNMLDFTESAINELKRFSKSKINQDDLSDIAKNLLYTKEIKRLLAEQLINPAPEFVKFFASQVYSGKMMASVVEKFTEIVQKSLKEFINEKITERLQSAMEVNPDNSSQITTTIDPVIIDTPPGNGIVTTEEELEGFRIVKSILRAEIDLNRIQYKDTKSYFGINLDGKVNKTICRLRFSSVRKTIIIFDTEGKEIKKDIDNLDGIYAVTDLLIIRLKFLLQN